jgi:hypothetical protein
MRAEDRRHGERIKRELRVFSRSVQRLPGIESPAALETLAFQIIESIRRIRYVSAIRDRPISLLRLDPSTELFDPIRAAILMRRADRFDEACWLVFLFTHFGKNLRSGYRLLRDVYGRLGGRGMWDWERTSNDTFVFRQWLDRHSLALKSDGRAHRGFGNHRKYQSLSAWKKNGTGDAVETYVTWVKSAGGHQSLFAQVLAEWDGDQEKAFRHLYREMDAVKSFGRTAKFDYLSMIGKTGLAPIEPDSVYFQTATGPVTGAKLLFHGDELARTPVSALESSADALAEALKIGKQAMEDSLCNWQKSPTRPVRFRG